MVDTKDEENSTEKKYTREEIIAFTQDVIWESLNDELKETKNKLEKRGPLLDALIYLIAAFFLGGGIGLIILFKWWTAILGISLGLFGLLMFLVGLSTTFERRALSIRKMDLENELFLQTVSSEQAEERAEHLLKRHELKLDSFYNQILKQSRATFFIGIVTIGVGLGIIIYLFYLLKGELIVGLETKVIVAIVGVIAALTSNFIGVIYIKMYEGATKSASNFHKRLVTTHHLHFVNFMLSKIKDENERIAAIRDFSKNYLTRQSVEPD